MLFITGGPERYFSATNELWDFSNSKFAIWNGGTDPVLLGVFGASMLHVMGIGSLFAIFALYALIRTGFWRLLSKEKVLFFSLWLIPAFILDIFIFLYPGVMIMGYGLFFAPALLILVSVSIQYSAVEIKRVIEGNDLRIKTLHTAFVGIVITVNTAVFLMAPISVSAGGIREHDQHLSTLLSGIRKKFPAESTIIFNEKAYVLYSFRHIQYYLPDYRTYLTYGPLKNNRGEKWHVFGGMNGKTFLADAVHIPENTQYIIHFMDPSDRKYAEQLEAKNFHRFSLDDNNILYYEEIKR